MNRPFSLSRRYNQPWLSTVEDPTKPIPNQKANTLPEVTVTAPRPSYQPRPLITDPPGWLDLTNRVRPLNLSGPDSPTPTGSPSPNKAASPDTTATKPTRYNGLNANNIMNVGRVIAGLTAANTQYPDETDTSKFDTLVADAEARREQGLSARSRAVATDALADNRSNAYEALRRNMGGGSSSGAVLAGLRQIGQTEVGGDVAIAQADEAQRERNRYDYQRLLGAQMDIANSRFNRQFDAVQATRQAGLNLIPQGLKGITDDYATWKQIEDPASPHARLLNSQADLAEQQAKIADQIYRYNAQRFLNDKPTQTVPKYIKRPEENPPPPTFNDIFKMPNFRWLLGESINKQ